MKYCAIVLCCVPFLLWQQPGLAATSADQVCDQAAKQAATAHGVPLAILQAVTRAETGRKSGGETHPWPWAVNLGGEGHWPPTAEAAAQIAQRALDEGKRNIDVGCFQLNIRWHSKNFSSLQDMLDPWANADHAAKFLAQLHAETGSWQGAVGAYHSREAERAAAYTQRVASFAGTEPPEEQLPSVNAYPLLQPGTVLTAGSLFAVSQTVLSPLLGGGY